MDVGHFFGRWSWVVRGEPAAGLLAGVERSIVGMFVGWGGSKWEVSEFDYLTMLRKTDPNCAMQIRIFW